MKKTFTSWVIVFVAFFAVQQRMSAQSLNVVATSDKGAYANNVFHVLENEDITFSTTFTPAETETVVSVESANYEYSDTSGSIEFQFVAPNVTFSDFTLSSGATESVAKRFVASMNYTSNEGPQNTSSTPIQIDVCKSPSCSLAGVKDTVFYYSTPSETTWSVNLSGGYNEGWSVEWDFNGEKYPGMTFPFPEYTNTTSSIQDLTVKVTIKNEVGSKVWYSDTKEIPIKIYPKAELTIDGLKSVDKYKEAKGISWGIKTNGGNSDGWSYHWAFDEQTSNEESFTMPDITNETEIILSKKVILTAKNTAPDGETVWEDIEEVITVNVYPQANAKIESVSQKVFDVTYNTGVEDGLQINVLPTGGNTAGWSYEWSCNGILEAISEDQQYKPKSHKNEGTKIEYIELACKAVNKSPNGGEVWEEIPLPPVTIEVRPRLDVDIEGGTEHCLYINTEQLPTLKAVTEGGEVSGWKFSWKYNGEEVSTGSELSYHSRTNSTQEVQKDSLTLVVTYYDESRPATAILEKKFDVRVDIYPEANCGDASGPMKSECKYAMDDLTWIVSPEGGNSAGWKYEWKLNGALKSNTPSYTLKGHSNDTGTTEKSTVSLVVSNVSPVNSKEVWYSRTYEATVILYSRPHLTVPTILETFSDSLVKVDINVVSDPQSTWTYRWGLNDGRPTEEEENPTHSLYAPNHKEAKAKDYTISLHAENSIHSAFGDSTIVLESGIDKETTLRVYSVGHLSSEKIHVDTLNVYGGLTEKDVLMTIMPIGGYPDGWTYKWYDNNQFLIENEEPSITQRYSNNSDVEYNHTFRVEATNRLGHYICPTLSASESFTIWPVCRFPEDMTIVDHNNEATDDETFCVREGNFYTLNVEGMTGGYRTHKLAHQWTISDGTTRPDANRIQAVIESSTNKKQIVDCPVKVNVQHIGPYDHVWDARSYTKTIKIYKRPLTPSELKKKGSGASRTMIATMPILNDEQLEQCEYYLVFGYTDANNTPHDLSTIRQSTGTTRYCTFPEDVFNNSSNRFYVYALWVYADGSNVTSGKRYVNGVDEDWDGSEYKAITRGEATAIESVSENDDLQDAVVYDLNGHHVYNTNSLKPGIYVREKLINGQRVSTKFMVK